MNNITLASKDTCTGCEACANICPENCISMKPDYAGFIYPSIDVSLCIGCKSCVRVCPVLNPPMLTYDRNVSIAANNKDDNCRAESSSGGIFSLFSEKIIEQGGTVFGASFADDFSVEHCFADTLSEAKKFRGSKYVQSRINYTFREVKKLLDCGKAVLYSGTPCQIAGLRGFLGKDYDKLYVQDIICHGVPSQLSWKSFLADRERNAGGKVSSVSFRSKKNGWSDYSLNIGFTNGETYEFSHKNDSYMSAYLKNANMRESCYFCKFRDKKRYSDITIADLWGGKDICPPLFDDKGTTFVLLNTAKGQKLWNLVREKIESRYVHSYEVYKANPAYYFSPELPEFREAFIKAVSDFGFDIAVDKLKSKSLMGSAFSQAKNNNLKFKRDRNTSAGEDVIVIYNHDGSENHGCEAIIRSTCGVFNSVGTFSYNIMSTRANEDVKYGIDKIAHVFSKNIQEYSLSAEYLKKYISCKLSRNFSALEEFGFEYPFIKTTGKNRISLLVGGDSYFYNYEHIIKSHNYSRKYHGKTVLWGYSMDKHLLENPEILSDMKNFDLIVVRESISYSNLVQAGVNNVVLAADPAFTLPCADKVNIEIPDNSVGLNLSPLVLKYNSGLLDCYEQLARYILEKTDMNIVLVPHVAWSFNDDRSALEALYERIGCERVKLIPGNYNCMELKTCISKLRFLITARTHASIAAYSTGVPTLVVGYSVKSKGIAKDLFGTYENYVISQDDIKQGSFMVDSFRWIYDNEYTIKSKLQSVIPEYKKSVYDAAKRVIALKE